MKHHRFSPIGLDVGSRWIKAVQISHTRDGLEVCAATRLRRTRTTPELGPAEADSLVGVLSRQGFQGERFVLSAPQGRLLRLGFELPPRESGAPLAMLARAELARVGKCDQTAMEMCWW